MSKTTKALAILGVVAGLGVAALPFNAMAATTNKGMTIVDADGTNTGADSGSVKYDGAKDGNVSDDILVRTTIKDTLSLAIVGANDNTGTEGNHLILLGTNGELKNGENGSGAATVTVATNHLGGYQVKMHGEAAGFNGTTNTSEKFAPIADDTATFPTSGDSVFGYQTTKEDAVTNITLSNVNWNGLKGATDINIATGAKATESAGDTFKVNFQVHASQSQAADTYDEVVTITATTNLSAGA